jgi:DNA-binding transcriptional regulator YiaG
MKKKETLIYEGLGFPIRLINVPLKKVFNEWILDINLNHLQTVALHVLAKKLTRLTAQELHFIRTYLEMSTHSFAKLCGVTHVAVLKWENATVKINPATEVYIRLYLLNYLKVTAKEFKKAFSKIKLEFLENKQENTLLEIYADKNDLIAC